MKVKPNNSKPKTEEQEIIELTPEMEVELSNGKEEGEE